VCMMPAGEPQRTPTLFSNRESYEEAEVGVGSLPPSSGPTQVGTTPVLGFRAVLRGREVPALEVAALYHLCVSTRPRTTPPQKRCASCAQNRRKKPVDGANKQSAG
jgi:hypothetical protein